MHALPMVGWAGHLHASLTPPPPTRRQVPAGAIGLMQGYAGRRGQAPGAVWVPGQHTVIAGAMLPTEGDRRLDHT